MLLLQQVMALVGKAQPPEKILREMLHLMSELLGLNRGRVVLRDADPQQCSIRYAYGLSGQEMARGVYRLGEGITGHAIKNGQLIIIQDIDRDDGFLFRTVARKDLPPGTVAFLALPIRIEDKTIGVLACHRIRVRNRSLSNDIALLRILGTLTSHVLHLQSMLEAKTRALEEKNRILTQALENASARYGIIGTSPPLLRAIAELEQVSSATASVLLLGESGTGKELFARALHLASPRRDKPFIKVNCAAIPESLFESELFGHERGAFTGANAAREGHFEQATRGTIFLDEIGELPLTMQGKLLRTLQEGTLTRLGGKREIKIDVRLVAATNRDLQAEVEAGRFRQDLFYRLNVIPIQLPSLAERRGDIRALTLHFLNHTNQANQRNVNLAPDAYERMERYDWPGNIRELSNFIERLVLLADKPIIGSAEIERFMPGQGLAAPLKTLPGEPPRAEPDVGGARSFSSPPHSRPYMFTQSHTAEQLTEAMRQAGGNKSRAAQLLNITARQFTYRWDKFGLPGKL